MIEYNTQNALVWSRLGSRGAFGMALGELAGKYDDLIVLAADVAASANLSSFAQLYPQKFLNVGIAEQNMAAMAAGLAKEGYKVFIVSFAPFASMRCFEIVRSYLGYMHLNVTVVGIASGLSMGVAGNTHFGLEDISIMRTIPGMAVIGPADCTETVKALSALLEYEGPAYLRLTGIAGAPAIYKTDYNFQIGKGSVLSQGTDVAVIANGATVYECTRAARVLAKDGISCTVVDMHTIKPLDTELLDKLATSHRLLATVEEGFLTGGLGSAVAEYFAPRASKPRQIMLGICDSFQHSGIYGYLIENCGLSAQQMADRIKSEILES